MKYKEERILDFIKKLEEIENIDATYKLVQHHLVIILQTIVYESYSRMLYGYVVS